MTSWLEEKFWFWKTIRKIILKYESQKIKRLKKVYKKSCAIKNGGETINKVNRMILGCESSVSTYF